MYSWRENTLTHLGAAILPISERYALRYSTLLYATIRYYTLLYATLRYSTLFYATLRYATLRYSTLLYATLRYSTLHYNKATLFYINCVRMCVKPFFGQSNH
jgi:uncharacterized protein YjbI with pentapeptide repeats